MTESQGLARNNTPKVFIGAILFDKADKSYATSHYLPYFIKSIKAQDYDNIELIFVDNSELVENDNISWLKVNYPQATIIRTGENLGFAKSYNLMIKKAVDLNSEYFIASNLDMIYEGNVVTALINAVGKNPHIGSATCKIKRWDYAARDSGNFGKTNILDTAGIEITKSHRFIDRGQGEIDHGQYNREEEIFGASGALAIYRLSAIEDTAFIREDGDKEYFDELMFMYKEDADLSYRLQLAGYKSIYTSSAVVYHDRTVAGQGRSLRQIIKSRQGRRKEYKEWSWLNHHIILQKIPRNDYSIGVRAKTFWYGIKSNFYLLIFEPHVLKQWLQLFKLRKKIQARRDQLKIRISLKNDLEKLMR